MDDRLPRKLAAILYADVAGYSRLTGDDEDATHRILSEYLDLIADTVESYHGKVMHYAGDAVLARFDAVVDSVSAATEIQELLAERNEKLVDDRRLQFRIGLSLGDVIEDRGDIYGDGVNIAARLESLADSGGICISESIRTAIGNKFDRGYEDLGLQEVKNIAEPVRAYRIKGTARDLATNPKIALQGKTPERPSIVVMQFESMSKDTDDEYFVAGVTAAIMTNLCRYREIVVAAKSAAILVSEQKLDMSEAANKLGVQYALSGSVRRAGDRVRITACLTEGETGHQIWSEQYDHVLDDIFQVQDEVSQKIVNMLVGKIERSDRERSLVKETDSLTAYECVLQGRYYFNDWHGSEEEVRHAREMFEKAIELDPRYAAAYAGLAATYHEDYKRGWSDSPENSGEKCIELAKKSIELDEQDSFPHLVLSSIYWHFKLNFELAKSKLQTAIELNPNDYATYCYGCWFSTCSGDLDKSKLLAKEAIRRNPILPDGCLGTLGISEYLSGKYENAIATICQITNLEPESYACLAASYAQLGRVEEAKNVAEGCVEHGGECTLSTDDWRKFWVTHLDLKEQGSVDHLLDGLNKAGLVQH